VLLLAPHSRPAPKQPAAASVHLHDTSEVTINHKKVSQQKFNNTSCAKQRRISAAAV
jgi:hypothetical protein